jgi:hypothetical protein
MKSAITIVHFAILFGCLLTHVGHSQPEIVSGAVFGTIDDLGEPVLTADRSTVVTGLCDMYPGWLFDSSSIHIVGSSTLSEYSLVAYAAVASGDSTAAFSIDLQLATDLSSGDTVICVYAGYWTVTACIGHNCNSLGCNFIRTQPYGWAIGCTPCPPPPNDSTPRGVCETIKEEVPDPDHSFFGFLVSELASLLN